MKNLKKIKSMFCKHDYKLFANIYGDLVNDLNAKTVFICKKCGKRKFISNYIEAPINYNNFLYDCYQYRKTGNLNISSETIKNKSQYKEIFGIEEPETVWKIKLESVNERTNQS